MPNANYILFDPPGVTSLLPLAYTRAVADFRIGIFTIKEKWELYLDKNADVVTRDYLQPQYQTELEADAKSRYINSAVLPDASLVEAITDLKTGEALYQNGELLAWCSGHIHENLNLIYSEAKHCDQKEYSGDLAIVRQNWDIFKLNRQELLKDIELVSISGNGFEARMALSVRQADDVYIEEGAKVDGAILNASDGPIYIGKSAHIMDGAIIRGPVAICDHAVVKMGAKIYPDTTIGPWCKVGGEISNSVLFAYSNKGHDGYLGNSVLGEWCNLGADTNTSNLKNNYSTIKSWDYGAKDFVDTKLQFCGLVMGDHSKAGINTMFNTGTVVGVSCNVFGGGFPPKFVPSFSWGGREELSEFLLSKAFEVAQKMMERRKVDFTDIHRTVLEIIFRADFRFR